MAGSRQDSAYLAEESEYKAFLQLQITQQLDKLIRTLNSLLVLQQSPDELKELEKILPDDFNKRAQVVSQFPELPTLVGNINQIVESCKRDLNDMSREDLVRLLNELNHLMDYFDSIIKSNKLAELNEFYSKITSCNSQFKPKLPAIAENDESELKAIEINQEDLLKKFEGKVALLPEVLKGMFKELLSDLAKTIEYCETKDEKEILNASLKVVKAANEFMDAASDRRPKKVLEHGAKARKLCREIQGFQAEFSSKKSSFANSSLLVKLMIVGAATIIGAIAGLVVGLIAGIALGPGVALTAVGGAATGAVASGAFVRCSLFARHRELI